MREVKPTQKPVPSSDVKDLFFNSGLLDIWATSLERKYIDRFGNCHLTAAGMEWIFNELVTKFKIESEQALLAAGYAPAGTFQEGAEVVSRNGTVLWKLPDGDGEHYRWDGDLPKQVIAGSTPQSTGGIGKGAWVSVGDASLRGDLKQGDGSLVGISYGMGRTGNLNEYLSLMFSNVINVQLHGILADNSDHSDALSYLITNAPPQSILYFPNGDYLLRGIKVQRDDISIVGQSIDGVRITLGAGSDGIFWRCGVRGPMSDTRNDNIPVYAGNDDFYVAANCSPALPDYPRNKNIKLNNITFILTDRFGTGNGVGVEFHRLDDYEKNIKIEWESEFEFGNGCRHYFCNGLKSDIFVTAPNKNTTYSVLYFWSFGARIGEWQIGEGKVLNIDFKHAVDLQAKVIKGISTTGLTGGAVQFGYGSRNINVGTLQGIGAGIRLRAAEEFERAKSFTIDKLVIDNPEGDGLTLGHVDNLNIGNYDIRAKTPLTFTFIPYLVSSSEDVNFIPKKNTSRWVYDGNYDITRTNGNITKYLEYRANPTLSRFKFGVGTLTKVGASEAAVYFNIAGGSEPFYDANGLLPRINSMPDRTINTSRADAIYDGQPPAALHRGDFGEMNIIYESGASSNSGAVFMGGQVNDVVGKINLSPRTATVWLALLNSNITLNFRQPQTAAGSPLIRLYLMQNSSLDGDWQCGSYPVLFENYAFNEKISGNFGANFIFNSTPIDAPLIRTLWSKEEPLESTNSISFNGAKCPPLANLRQLIRHYGTVKNPNGVDEIGGGLSCEGGWFRNVPMSRVFTHSNSGTEPPLKANHVGELAVNVTTSTWWKASSLSNWTRY